MLSCVNETNNDNEDNEKHGYILRKLASFGALSHLKLRRKESRNGHLYRWSNSASLIYLGSTGGAGKIIFDWQPSMNLALANSAKLVIVDESLHWLLEMKSSVQISEMPLLMILPYDILMYIAIVR